MNAIVPIPRCSINIRPATAADLPFVDHLQKMHNRMVGWMPRKQLEGKLAAQQLLVAQGAGAALGYVIAQDQYFKHDDIGIIYQLNVVPTAQRKLVGAMLIKAVFERAAYGCKLFCCWCAQDIQANYFWESIGFIPLAFRTGSASKQRTHIFWQRRIREGDTTTPYWFPSQTSAGSLREDRLVLPIPPGTNWRDAKPLVLPKEQLSVASGQLPVKARRLASSVAGGDSQPTTPARKMAIVRSQSKHLCGLPPGKAAVITSNGLRYIDRGDYVPEPVVEAPKPKRALKPRVKNDPAHVAAARELRDRYLEQFNSGLVLANGKYDVSRALEGAPAAAPLLLEQKAA